MIKGIWLFKNKRDSVNGLFMVDNIFVMDVEGIDGCECGED